MSKVKIELNSKGIQELLKSAEMQGVLNGYAQQKATAAGKGYASAVHVFTKRAAANIYPDTPEASSDNYENNTLLKVIGS